MSKDRPTAEGEIFSPKAGLVNTDFLAAKCDAGMADAGSAPLETNVPASHTITCDALIVGSGASGMAAAIVAHQHGLDVRVIEKEEVVGGATALSYGMLWIPCNPVATRSGIVDDREAAIEYLRSEMGDRFDQERVHAYLDAASRMVEYFEKNSAVRFVCRDDFPDHHSDKQGAGKGGRTITVEPYDGRQLGPQLGKLRPPMQTQTWLGMMYTPKENKLIGTRTWRAFRHVAKRLLRHSMDMLRFGRTTWLTNGNALSARLLHTATELDIPIWTSSPMQRLVIEDGRICGAIIEHGGRQITLRARRGVVLACGGFGHDIARCEELFAHPPLGRLSWSLAPKGNTGDGLRAAVDVGAQIDRELANAAFWAPVSRAPGEGAEMSGHFYDRHRPGFMAVTRSGHRFANEAASNHHFIEALIHATTPDEEAIAFLICDHRAIRRTGCGDFIFPSPIPFRRHLRSGYLVQADNVAQLAARIGIDPDTLVRTIDEFNQHARDGHDPLFGKGDTAFNQYFGDSRQRPNACLGPLEQGPFYAVQMTIGHMGTLAGLKTDLFGRALDQSGIPIAGLYAVGNDMANIFGGACPGGGITLGPGMTFGYIVGQHLAGTHIDGISEQMPTEEVPVVL